MAKPVLYSYFRSSCTWRVRIALEYKGIDYEIKPVNLIKDGGEQNTEEFKKLNPMAQVPVLAIDDNYLVQSLSILEYLEEKFPTPPILPKDPISRSKVRAVAECIASGIQPLQNLKALKNLPEETRGSWARDCIENGFTALEKMLKSYSGKYCVGDAITIADFCLVPQVYNAVRFKVDLNGFPLIKKINATLLEHDAFIKSHPSNQDDCPSDQKIPIK